MNTLIPQQLVDAQSVSFQQVFHFSATAFNGLERLTALNLQVVKTTLAENQAIVNKALSAKPEELFALSADLAKPTGEKVAAYSRQVYEILSGTQAELASAAQAQFKQSQDEAKGFVAKLTKNSPLANTIVVAE
ncbi:phasin family protein [Paraburkholderia sp. RAU2J]|uniref:phasin family protein n=1 Tax=Paraburkholderia sp. RAU2J TaxID=1938810 RepID=UPI000EB12186|nr:phasin family protein [Paraburkholderia sp. RAU2J]RKT22870.1 phasin family protein [Paraburkholderia sp. RAU2J]